MSNYDSLVGTSCGKQAVLFKPLNLPQEYDWFAKRNPIFWVHDHIGIVAYRKGEIAGVGIVDNRIENSAQLHFVLDDPIVLRHGFFEAYFEMGFAYKRKFLYGMVSSHNAKIIKLCKHVGFTEKCVLEDARKDGEDYVLLQLKREDCKYLEENNGQAVSTTG